MAFMFNKAFFQLSNQGATVGKGQQGGYHPPHESHVGDGRLEKQYLNLDEMMSRL